MATKNRRLEPQYEVLREMGIEIEESRAGAGSHRVLYCHHPASGARFLLTLYRMDDAHSRSLQNFRSICRKAINENRSKS